MHDKGFPVRSRQCIYSILHPLRKFLKLMHFYILIQEGTEGQTSNVSSYVNSGKYLCPYRAVKTNNLMYDAGYTWCEAHYLNPIAITHFRITASNPNDLSTSIIYQNPGWPIQANEGPIGIK